MSFQRSLARTDDGVIHLLAHHVDLLICRGNRPTFVDAPPGACATCFRCIANADMLDALHRKPKIDPSFRDALP